MNTFAILLRCPSMFGQPFYNMYNTKKLKKFIGNEIFGIQYTAITNGTNISKIHKMENFS